MNAIEQHIQKEQNIDAVIKQQVHVLETNRAFEKETGMRLNPACYTIAYKKLAEASGFSYETACKIWG